jgi:hypothetical protein
VRHVSGVQSLLATLRDLLSQGVLAGADEGGAFKAPDGHQARSSRCLVQPQYVRARVLVKNEIGGEEEWVIEMIEGHVG